MFSDISNAELFTELYKGKVVFCNDLGGWFIYNGKMWEHDKNTSIKALAIDASKTFIRRCEVAKLNKDLWWGHAKKISNNSGLNAMIDCSKSYLGVASDDFDSKGYYFNCLNGTYDLENFNLIPHDSSHLLNKISNIVFDSNAECPKWINFINEISLERKTLAKFLQKACGYCLTDDTSQQCMFILHGSGRNGKSVFLDIVGHILGDYAMNCPSDTLIETQNQQTNGIARLKGARLATTVETNQNVSLDEKTIKSLTGKDKITAKFLYKEFFDFKPTFKIFLATNNKPNIRGTDEGIWRRIRMIPFELVIDDSKDNRTLSDDLKKEASGILNWMIEGYRLYKQEGLLPPEEVHQATKLYREEEDDIGQFIEDECVLEIGRHIEIKEFKEKFYRNKGYHKGQKALGEYMERKGLRKDGGKLRINGKEIRAFVNIRFKDTSDQILEQKAIKWTD